MPCDRSNEPYTRAVFVERHDSDPPGVGVFQPGPPPLGAGLRKQQIRRYREFWRCCGGRKEMMPGIRWMLAAALRCSENEVIGPNMIAGEHSSCGDGEGRPQNQRCEDLFHCRSLLAWGWLWMMEGWVSTHPSTSTSPLDLLYFVALAGGRSQLRHVWS